MKTFEIITEADARVLERGATVLLARGGHVTPLASDTLRERRITVLEEGRASAADLSLVPVEDIRSVAIGSDHAGVALRRVLMAYLRGRGLAVQDLGTEGPDPVDYPDVAAQVAKRVERHEADAGIVIDAAGVGSAIAANKIPGVRAAMATSESVARYARAHSGANVLTLGAALVTADEAKAILAVWLTTPMRDPQDIRRLAKIRDLEIGGGIVR
jgi:ribose 5-phosphate isomerase B